METLEAAHVSHSTNAQQGTARRGELLNTLRKGIRAINRTGRAVALDHTEYKDLFRTSESGLNDTELLALAHSLLQTVTPLKGLFTEYDMPDDFLEKFEANINDFEGAIRQQHISVGRRSETQAGIAGALDRADAELEKLNTAMLNKDADAPRRSQHASKPTPLRLRNALQANREQTVRLRPLRLRLNIALHSMGA